jgi:hypothetical protein
MTAFPLEPADRRHQPGATGGAAFPRHVGQSPGCASPGRPWPRRGRAARQCGAARGAGDDLQRRHHDARTPVRRRPLSNAVGRSPARLVTKRHGRGSAAITCLDPAGQRSFAQQGAKINQTLTEFA